MLYKATAALLAASTLAGCGALPRSGPDDALAARSAAQTVTSADKKVGIEYVMIDINTSILPFVAVTQGDSFRGGFGSRADVRPDQTLGVGDILSVSIFESGAGGLFIPIEAGSRPGNFVTLPSQEVDRSGTITIPYAGRIQAAGRSIPEVQAAVEETLVNRAIEPQVVINRTESRSNQVSVLGDVEESGRLALNPAGERILDVISRAGGLSTPGAETYVTLQRGGKQATVLFNELVKNPRENIYAAAGDVIYVNRERRTYLAFGATGLNGRFDFDESALTLGEALGKAGGLLDGRADPAQTLLYRIVDRDQVAKMGIDVSQTTARQVPVIFRANLRDPAGYFAAQQFPMQDKDILYVSNSDSVELIKFLSLVNSISTTYSGVAIDANQAKTAVQNLTN